MNTTVKNNVLKSLSELLSDNRQKIIDANHQDISRCDQKNTVLYDRVKIDDKKISGMISAINQIIALDDPENNVLSIHHHSSGLIIENRSVALGTVLLIYESRPDVTIEAAAIAFKAGNKIILKGGKEAVHTNLVLTQLWQMALRKHGYNTEYVGYLDVNRELLQKLIRENSLQLDLIIARGGEKLIRSVTEQSSVPVIASGRGNNFLYIDHESDFAMAENIILNGKERLSVCNALDKILVNKSLPNLISKLATLMKKLNDREIMIHGDKGLCSISDSVVYMETDELMKKEFLSADIAVRLVDDVDKAVCLINEYSGKHSAAIITENTATAKRFMQNVDCAAVYHNASIRFTDGGEFGLGSEVAISTQKLHARGPLGAQQLVTNKWFISGNGQVRI